MGMWKTTFLELDYINMILDTENVFNGLHKLREASLIGGTFSLLSRL